MVIKFSEVARQPRESAPYPVSRRRRDVDGQRPRKLQDLNAQHQGHVGDLRYLLSYVLILCGFLEVFGLCYLVHESQDFPACPATCVPVKDKDQEQSIVPTS